MPSRFYHLHFILVSVGVYVCVFLVVVFWCFLVAFYFGVIVVVLFCLHVQQYYV